MRRSSGAAGAGEQLGQLGAEAGEVVVCGDLDGDEGEAGVDQAFLEVGGADRVIPPRPPIGASPLEQGLRRLVLLLGRSPAEVGREDRCDQHEWLPFRAAHETMARPAPARWRSPAPKPTTASSSSVALRSPGRHPKRNRRDRLGQPRQGDEREVRLSADSSGIVYTLVKDGIGCPLSGTGSYANGSLRGAVRLSI